MRKRIISKGLVHVYTGDGKGKTCAALGLALRAIGWGARVCVIQFIKGYPDIGELHFAAAQPGCLVLKQFAQDGALCIDEAKVKSREKEAAAALDYAREVLRRGEFDVVILDEINNAVHHGLIKLDDVLALIAERPASIELVLTGRNAPEKLIEAADYVTVMKSVKHPFDKGIRARKGVDF